MQRNQVNAQALFILGREPTQFTEFGLPIGIFSVCMSSSDGDWRSYLEATFDMLDRTSSVGFDFNSLASHSDIDKMRDYLYFNGSCVLFDLCKLHYLCNAALIHGYRLYLRTIPVRNHS